MENTTAVRYLSCSEVESGVDIGISQGDDVVCQSSSCPGTPAVALLGALRRSATIAVGNPHHAPLKTYTNTIIPQIRLEVF